MKEKRRSKVSKKEKAAKNKVENKKQLERKEDAYHNDKYCDCHMYEYTICDHCFLKEEYERIHKTHGTNTQKGN